MRTSVTGISVVLVNAAEFTNWVFVEVATDGGVTGTGEACLSGQEQQVEREVDRIRSSLVGRNVFELETNASSESQQSLLAVTVNSALDQAIWDVKAALLGVPLWQLLGGSRRAVPLYANINRASRNRAPEAMAELARRAVASGFHGVKCAPLDGVDRSEADSSDRNGHLSQAVERVAAIREAIGVEAPLMVDCHWRLTLPLARELVDRLEQLNLTWLEDPFPEEAEDEWLALKEHTQIPLAGGERATTLGQLARALSIGQYDICCPDVRNIGGAGALWHASHLVQALGADFAPHNPRGPVGSVVSAHVCSASPRVMILEFPFGECDWRSTLVGGAENIEMGNLWLSDVPGSGVRLNHEVVSEHPFRHHLAPRERSQVDIW